MQISDTTAHAPGRGNDLPPWYFWMIPLAGALLRAIPYLVNCITQPGEGQARLPLGYNVTDTMAYAGFIQLATEQFSLALPNPFTSMAQDGRYFLPLFSLLGGVAQVTSLDPFFLLECSRVPLLFLFFGVLWWFLQPIFESKKDRLIASLLVGFSGGLEYLVLPFLAYFPPELREVTGHDLSNLFGWHTFASFFNPLWLLGLTGTLVTLRPLFEEKAGSFRTVLRLGLGAAATYLLHPYSGLVTLAVIGLYPFIVWLNGLGADVKRALWMHGGALLLFGLLAGPLALWQKNDLVYQLTAQKVMGKWDVPVFWYPAGLGLVGLLALIGWRDMLRNHARLTVPLGAWTASVILLHSSPLLNGFHFVFHLHLPVCMAAVIPFRQFWEKSALVPKLSLVRLGLVAGLFISTLYTTYVSAVGALSFQTPAAFLRIADHLKSQPRGNVWASPELSNILPGYTGQFVYAGHWFLTPHYATKRPQYESFLKGEFRAGELTKLFRNERIRYAVLPKTAHDSILKEVGAIAESSNDFGEHLLFVIGNAR